VFLHCHLRQLIDGLQIWDLSQGKHLFDALDDKDETTKTVHLAEMIALLGNPPKAVLDGSPIVGEFFDNDSKIFPSLRTERRLLTHFRKLDRRDKDSHQIT
jgi:hypothetical protein